MSTTQMSNERATQVPSTAKVDLKLEVVVIPVSDVDRAKRFYENLGWRLDADFTNGVDWRVVQMTPPGSPCSIHFGKGVTTAVPGSVKNLYLVVSDVEAARGELIRGGADVSEAFHFTAFGGPPAAGPAPDRASYRTFAAFSDPDGNSWLLQEIKTRLPGRGNQPGRRCSDRIAARDRGAPRQVRTDRSEAPLVGVVRRLHCRARARRNARGRSQGCCAPSGSCPPMKADIEKLAALSVCLLAFASLSHAQTKTTSDAVVVAAVGATGQAAEDGAIRPFTVKVPKAALDDLRRRIAATRWPDKETVADQSQGAQLAKLQALVRYWGSGYDWRKVEKRLNSLPQFVTTIDGVDIHFIHVRSRQPNALPVIITHGWPGSVIEQLKIIGPLADPTAHGGSAQDAFDVVIPSVPGYGFSGKPTGTAGTPIASREPGRN